MKRSIKVFVLLIISLFIVVRGVDSALDQISRLPTQSNLTFYSDKGDVVYAYSGDLHLCKVTVKPGRPTAPEYVHRG
jgi:hypothetical protein